MDELKELIGQSKLVFKHADSSDELNAVYRLRYEVYCNESHFLDPQQYPDGMESDKYDPHSIHFAVSDQYGMIGAVRLVLDSPNGFPFEEHCRGKLHIDIKDFSRNQAVEISRLVISKRYRRRAADGLSYTPDFDDNVTGSDLENIAKRVRPMAFGLYREMYQESKRRGIRYWFALMEKPLCFLLRIHGFVFKPIGEEVDLYGIVDPYLADVEEVERSVYQKSPKFAKEYFVQGLERQHIPKFII
ncbi:MAG: PEP-CTERM/exosortase system-associated acyltransferase [Candidatus Omnitrophota bacterium]